MVRFTPAHLRHELARRLARRSPLGGLAILVGLALGMVAGVSAAESLANGWFIPFFLLTLASVLVLWHFIGRTKTFRSPFLLLGRSDFDRLWQRWLAAHGEPKGLIVRRAQGPVARPLPTDIEEYSFDRAVICDRSESVDLLLANNFHFENNCALLSADGYPEHAFQTVRAMLQRNPKLVVYVLHDATPAGCTLAQQIASSPEWFPDATVIDVGLRPGHSENFYGAFERPERVPEASPALTSDERAWLRYYALELAAVLPEQVIKRLFSALARPIDLSAGALIACGAFYVENEALRKQATASDGGGDSFG